MGGRDFIFGALGNDIIDGGTGNDYLLGGAGSDTFIFGGSFGVDTIGDFQAGAGGDVVFFDTFRSFAQVQSSLYQVDADGDGALDDAYIIVRATDTVHLLNVNIASLTAANFVFG